MVATADDYTWFKRRFPQLAEAFCLTMVRGLSPDEMLSRLGRGGNGTRLTGAAALERSAEEAWNENDGEVSFIGVTSVGEWSLAVEPNGYLGSVERVVVPLSAGTRLVSHFHNIDDHFYWIEDTDVRIQFGGADEPEQAVEVAFALAEYLTGISVTPELLNHAVFVCGAAKVPGLLCR
jgi:Family of unknown function (DUF6461)